MTENLIVGAGITGATLARLLAQAGQKVLVIDKKDHIAGHCYDYIDENNICIHKYGSHIFHTDNERVWNFLKPFADLNTYRHKVTALIDGIETTIPFNMNTLKSVFPDSIAQKLEEKLLAKYAYNQKIPIAEFKMQDDADLQFLARYVYEKVFEGYSTKQWGCIPDSSVTARVPVYISRDDRYFQDKYQGIPLGGYTKMIARMLNHPNVRVRLRTDYRTYKRKHDRIFYTGSIDEFFDYKFGPLPYRSLTFKLETHDKTFYQSNAVINYPCNYDFVRIHEYKYYLDDKSDKTVIAKEYSEDFELGKNDRYYPIVATNQALHNAYLVEAQKHNNLHFLGRLGDYKYYDMDDAITRALDVFAQEGR
ncbi:MAG: UDP-galactopyranose mutase [Holosporales bacterium]|jgi:UDP-galactopyranose mutase|nr:UDP-galactopyranose mutase [Holosporales bacterium]